MWEFLIRSSAKKESVSPSLSLCNSRSQCSNYFFCAFYSTGGRKEKNAAAPSAGGQIESPVKCWQRRTFATVYIGKGLSISLLFSLMLYVTSQFIGK